MKVSDGASVTRPYRMRARAQAADRRAGQVLDAAIELWRERWYDDITLEDLSQRSGVSQSTILRRFGSKDGVLEAVLASDRLGAVRGRDRIGIGDVPGAIKELIEHYEHVGDAVIRDLALEDRIPAVGRSVPKGRVVQREFVARVFSPWLPARRGRPYERRLAQFVVACDVYTWKLFRRDHGLSKAETALAMRELLDRLMKEE